MFTLDQIENAIMQDGVGFCTECGANSSSPVEPDAREYYCDVCDKYSVYGAEQILIEFPELVK